MNTPADTPSENPEGEKTIHIRTLNDTLRTTFIGGKIILTPGIQALAPETIKAIMHKIQAFNAFTEDNDPHEEHDFGAFDHEGHKVFWKIDYYDKTMTYGSEDPSDSEQTVRVLTVMLAADY